MSTKAEGPVTDIRDEVIAELRAVAMARPADCLRWEDGKLELKDELPIGTAAAISSIERTTSGVKLRFHDKLKALQLLLQAGNEKGSDPKSNLLEAILGAINGPIDTSDVPEIEEGETDEDGVFITEGS